MNRRSMPVFKCRSHFPCVVAVRAVRGGREDGVFVMIAGPLPKRHKTRPLSLLWPAGPQMGPVSTVIWSFPASRTEI